MERLGSLDAVFLAIEGPTSPMNVGSVGIFEGPAPSEESIQAFVAAKLDHVPRCRQRVREAPRHAARPVWIDDVHFDLGHHLHRASLLPDRPQALEQFVEQVMVRPLDRSRPLWEMWVVEGLDDEGWAVVSKVHHCLVDGIAGTDLLAVMMDAAPAAGHACATAQEPGWTPTPEPSGIALARFSATAAASSAWTHLRHLVRLLIDVRRARHGIRNFLVGAEGLWLQPSRRESPLTGPIGPDRRWLHTQRSLHDVATVRHACGGTVNDVVLTAIAHGFRELLSLRGVALDGRTVMALVPVSMRAPSERGLLDNRVAVTHALLPVDIEDPIVTYAAVRTHLDEVKASHETDASTVLLHSGDFTPHALAAVVARAVVRVQQNLETIATNVRGPQQPLYLGGRRMLAAYPFAPIAGRIRIAIAIWSYCDTLHIGVTGDRDGVPDLDALVRGIDCGFDGLLDAAVATER